MGQGPIRILHVLTAMNRAGAETMLMNLYRAIDRDRIQFDFAVTAPGHCDYDDEIAALGGRIIHYPRYTGTNHIAYRRWWADFLPAHPEYRIIHGHIGSTASIYLRIAKRNGRFAIAHSHNTFGRSVHDALYRLMSYSTRYIADYFFGCSEAALVSRFGRRVAGRRDICRVLPNGIDVQAFACDAGARRAVRESLGLGQDALVIGTVGRFTKQKNVFFILDILEALKPREPDFRFLWVGTGELKDQVAARISEKHLEENIRLLGVREDIPALLQALNAFILPSRYEGLPVIGVEVQAAGVPLLCSDRVSRELEITDCVRFLPIQSPEPWVEDILRERAFRRIPNAPAALTDAGYDVRQNSEWLTAFYMERVRENIAAEAKGGGRQKWH